jgi:hypothetical protein
MSIPQAIHCMVALPPDEDHFREGGRFNSLFTSSSAHPSRQQTNTAALFDELSQVSGSSSQTPIHPSNYQRPIGLRCDDSFLEAYDPDGSLDAPYLMDGAIDQDEYVTEHPTLVFPTPNLPMHSPLVDHKYEVFSKQELSLLRIMMLCDDANCPRYFFDKLVKLIRAESIDNLFDPSQKHPTRETLLRRLDKACPTPPPQSVSVPLQSVDETPPESVDVWVFNFLEQMKDLLSNHRIFGDLDNLDVNPNDRFGRYHRADGMVNEVNSGAWYQAAYNRLITDPENEMLFPVIIYVDKTGTDGLQRHGVEPVLVSTTVINVQARQSLESWKCIGYLPDLAAKSTAERDAAAGRKCNLGSSQRDYHACLDEILRSLIETQVNDNFIHCLRLGDQLKWVKIKFAVAFVINDGKSADMLCGRYGSYGAGCISRACNCDFDNCGDPHHQCTYRTQAPIEELQTIALGRYPDDPTGELVVPQAEKDEARLELRCSSLHMVNNAFHKVGFGGDPRGIYGCTPTDLMHAFLEGVLRYAMQNVFAKMTVGKKAAIDRIVKNVLRCQKNSLRRKFPRADFSHGITNLTLLTATEWCGVLFTVLLLSMLKSGQHALSQAYPIAGDKSNSKNSAVTTMDQLQEVLEALLAFHAWSKCSASYDVSNDAAVERLKISVIALLSMVSVRLPREEGNGWQLQKFHEILHLVDDIKRFGSPRNTDTGPGERSLKFFAKKQATTSQKRSKVFLQQVASRLHECTMFNKARILTDPGGTLLRPIISQNNMDGVTIRHPSSNHSDGGVDSVDDDDDDNDNDDNQAIRSELSGSVNPLFQILFSDNGYQGNVWNGKAKGHITIHPIVVKYFREDQRQRGYNTPVNGWTEYIRDNHRFRAHPNYRSNGYWYDWVMVNFQVDNDIDGDNVDSHRSKRHRTIETGNRYPDEYYPAKILCFFADPIDKEIMALVHSCDDNDHSEDSALCEVWSLEYQVKRDSSNALVAFPTIRAVPVSSFDEAVLVIEEMPGLTEAADVATNPHYSRCILVKNRERWWASEFC